MKFTLDQAWEEASISKFYRCRTLLAFQPRIKLTLRWSAVEIGGKALLPNAIGLKNLNATQQQSTDIISTTEFF
jgi:hypothetical protein